MRGNIQEIKIITDTTHYFEMDFHLAGLLAVKFRDAVFSFFCKSENKTTDINSNPITKEKRDELQYLAMSFKRWLEKLRKIKILLNVFTICYYQ